MRGGQVHSRDLLKTPSLPGWAKMDENVLVFATHNVVHGPLDITWHFTQLELQL
jgi:hypothetical protein